MNQCNFIGRLGRDPEGRHLETGTTVCNFSIAVSEKWTDKSGNKQESTEWINCVAWGKLGDIAGQYLSKGSQVYISGKMQTRSWTDKQNVKHYKTEINVRELEFLGGKQEERVQEPQEDARPSQDEYVEDDIAY